MTPTIIGIIASANLGGNPGAGVGLWGGGYNLTSPGTIYNVIDYVTISTTGNAADFGDLTVANLTLGSNGSGTRSLFAGGAESGGISNFICYVNPNSAGNATDFGDLTQARRELMGNMGNATRGVWGAGQDGSYGNINVIDYVTIATTGNATDFGDQTVGKYNGQGCASTTRGISPGGYTSTGHSNVIDYITIATVGNATDFGDQTIAGEFRFCSSGTRGVGYYSNYTDNRIDYITIATTGNATDFGDQSPVTSNNSSAAGSKIRAVWGGGLTSNPLTNQNQMQYITMATLGNGTDFGDLTVARYATGTVGSNHGGI